MELEEGTDLLSKQKENLDKERKVKADANEELERQLKAYEETLQKRLIAKLSKDKNPHMKELQQKVED